MGSFYALCSVTSHTICDGQPMYMQFMLPAGYISHEPSIGEVFKESFLNVVKSKGLDAAIKSFDESTATWSFSKELSPKGLNVSNDGSYQEWVPFGPAIRGFYDDCGDLRPAEDEDSLMRVKILEGLMGLPFETIMNIAQDDRWYTYGLGEYKDKPDWKPEGINNEMPEWSLKLCKQLSVTYFHAAVYDELSKFDFSPEERNGIMKSKYDIKWKNEYLDPIKKKFPIALKNLKDISNLNEDSDKDYAQNLRDEFYIKNTMSNIGVFRYMTREMELIYQACIAREECSLDWFYESLTFMYSLSGMCLKLQRSEYGSQHNNYYGWLRIYNALNVQLDSYLNDTNEEEEEDDEL